MKKEQSPKSEREKSDVQGDTVIRRANQAQVPFLCVPVENPFEKRKPSGLLKRELYRVIKLK